MQTQAPLLNPINSLPQRLAVSRATVWKLIADGKLPVVRIGRRTLVAETALQAFVANAAKVARTSTPTAPCRAAPNGARPPEANPNGREDHHMKKISDTYTKAQAASIRERVEHYTATNTPEQLEVHRRHYRGQDYDSEIGREIEARARIILAYDEDCCAACRFFAIKEGSRLGHCRRTSGRSDTWPNYKPDDWCGCYEPLLAVSPCK